MTTTSAACLCGDVRSQRWPGELHINGDSHADYVQLGDALPRKGDPKAVDHDHRHRRTSTSKCGAKAAYRPVQLSI